MVFIPFFLDVFKTLNTEKRYIEVESFFFHENTHIFFLFSCDCSIMRINLINMKNGICKNKCKINVMLKESIEDSNNNISMFLLCFHYQLKSLV